MPSPHDHHACVDKALKAADEICLHRGVRLTPVRRKVLELIWEGHQAVKAYDLLDRIRPFDFAAKPATVYRALEFLLANGLIHRVESLNAFVGCNSSETRHDHQLLLICSNCQEVEERPATEVMGALQEEFDSAGFRAQRKAIEVHGRCRKCEADRGAETGQG